MEKLESQLEYLKEDLSKLVNYNEASKVNETLKTINELIVEVKKELPIKVNSIVGFIYEGKLQKGVVKVIIGNDLHILPIDITYPSYVPTVVTPRENVIYPYNE